MKIDIKPFTKFLLRQNLPYIIVIFLLVILTLILPSVILGEFTKNQNKLNRLNKEVNNLKLRVTVLQSTLDQTQIDIEGDVQLLNQLIPDIENYFSIITALEQISGSTGFNIASFNVPFKATGEVLTINIVGEGDQNAFIKFLQNYNFASGRLITIDKIELGKSSGSFNLNLNFYNRSVKSISDRKVDAKLLKTMEELMSIKNKVNFVVKDQGKIEEELNVNYDRKANPF